MFKLNVIGAHSLEAPTFTINRPKGSGDYLFLFFATPIYVGMPDAQAPGQLKEVLFPANSCLLYTPSSPQFYHHPTEGFLNYWIHFDVTSATDTSNNAIDLMTGTDFFHNLDLPLNQPFHVTHGSTIRTFVRELEQAFIQKDFYYETYIHARLTQFFIDLARQVRAMDLAIADPHKAQMYQVFSDLRMKMLQNYAKPYSVDVLAESVALSRSRFSVLYKDFFGHGPKEELITQRFLHAQHFLESTHLSITEVAEKVGYDNLYHFSKQFKKITGVSPATFRK